MAPRRTVCTHITSIITNSSTSGGALAAAGSTHARGTLTLPTRDEEQAAAWLLALLAGQYLSIAAPMTPLSELISAMGLYDAAMQGLRAERREQVVSDGRERGRCASMQGVVEEVGRDAEVQRVSHAAADPFSARDNARATPQSLGAMAGEEWLGLKGQLYRAQRRARENHNRRL